MCCLQPRFGSWTIRPFGIARKPGDALLQKIEAIAFTLGEEEALSQTDVTRRARAAFDVERITKRFYDRFQKEHATFLKFVTGIMESAIQNGRA
ncbi:MAG: hypothetical protein ACREYF_02865 [Gammaproteobacteria bacterium]